MTMLAEPATLGADPSTDFLQRAEYISGWLRANHPDPEVRAGLSTEPLYAYASATAHDLAMVGVNPRVEGNAVLLGLHYGYPRESMPVHRLNIYEDAIRRAAANRKISVDDQLQETLLHELEHHWGWCPDGHTDCETRGEVRGYVIRLDTGGPACGCGL